MVDSIYRTRSLGIGAEGLPDQYADGKAAKVWEIYIGSKENRTSQYRQWICGLLRSKGCHTVLDVACGTGIDSIMLVEEGFQVISTDASDKMLKYALKTRWNRRKEEAFDNWVIDEANWLSLGDDLKDIEKPDGGFDAVICLGNSFAHLPDFEGNLAKQKVAISNFMSMLKPGGILLIDHRNYDAILDSGSVPAKNVYYNSSHIKDIKVSNLYVNCKPTLVTLDYTMDISTIDPNFSTHTFRLSYYPHRLQAFSDLLKDLFGENVHHEVFGDFKEYKKEENPAYFLHVIQKAKNEA